MTSLVSHTSVDCRDAFALATFWKQTLGYIDVPGDPAEPGHQECMILDPDTGHRILFLEVPEPKAGKNRIHFDLRPRDRDQQAEVDRLLGLGARLQTDRRGIYGAGSGWVVLTDPEGNEFCVLHSLAEVAALEAAADGA
jgi:hypothetical protein